MAYVIYTREDTCANDKLSPPVDHPKIRLLKKINKKKVTYNPKTTEM